MKALKFLFELFKLFKQNPMLVYGVTTLLLVFLCLMAAVYVTF